MTARDSPLDWTDLRLPLAELRGEELLAPWTEYVPAGTRVVLVNVFGDLFLQDPGGRVHWVNTVDGQVSKVADTGVAFKQALESRGQLAVWFMPGMVAELHERGLRPGTGQCYRFRKPPFQGGELSAGNVKLADVYEHQRLTEKAMRKLRKKGEDQR